MKPPVVQGHEGMMVVTYRVLDARQCRQSDVVIDGKRAVIDRVAVCGGNEGFYLFLCDSAWRAIYDHSFNSQELALASAERSFPGAWTRVK